MKTTSRSLAGLAALSVALCLPQSASAQSQPGRTGAASRAETLIMQHDLSSVSGKTWKTSNKGKMEIEIKAVSPELPEGAGIALKLDLENDYRIRLSSTETSGNMVNALLSPGVL